MSTGNSLPTWRQITVVAVIFFLLAGFTLMYYYYYIPRNQSHTNQYGLRILQLVEKNIATRQSNLEKLYVNSLKSMQQKQLNDNANLLHTALTPQQAKDTGLLHINFNNIVDSLRPAVFSDTPILIPARISDKVAIEVNSDWVYYNIGFTPSRSHAAFVAATTAGVTQPGKFVMQLNNDSLSVRASFKQTDHRNTPDNKADDTIRLGLRLRSLVRPMTIYRHEFFESFALIKVEDKHNGTLIFDDGVLTHMSERISLDTFFSSQQGDMFSRIIPMEIGGVKYMLFAQPFDLRDQSLMLCGIMKLSDYQEHLNTIPLNFIFYISIALLLVVMSLPFLKFKMIGKADHVGISDIVYICLALFVGTTIVTIIIGQWVILESDEYRSSAELRKLNGQVEERFYDETLLVSKEVHYLDSVFGKWVSAHGKDPARWRDTLYKDSSTNLPLKILSRNNTVSPVLGLEHGPDTYYNFDRVVWTNLVGDETYKAQRTSSKPIFISVVNRDYYKRFMNQQTYPEPMRPDSAFVLEPVYSQATGDFRINYAVRSHVDSMLLIMATTQLYSLVHTIFPAGYGCFLMDEQGQVLCHSEPQRNLRESFPEETDHPDFVLEAINSRQDTFFNTNYYGKDHAVFIHPLNNLPFFLVTYSEKEPQYAGASRILVFTLTFNSLLYVLILGLVFTIFFYPIRSSPILPVMEYLRWMIPKRPLERFYRNASWIGFGGGLLLLMLAVMSRGNILDDHLLFTLGLLIPADVVLLQHGYYRNHYGRGVKPKWCQWLPLVMMALASIFLFMYMRLYNCQFWWEYAPLQAGVLIVTGLLLYDNSKEGQRLITKVPALESPRYIFQYGKFVTSLIFSIAIIPTIVFSLYAYNHEITQTMKQQGLFLARRLQNERAEIWRTLFPELPAEAKHSQAQYRQYTDGLFPKSVYSVYNTQVHWLNDLKEKNDSVLQRYFHPGVRPESQQCFYFKISNQITTDYHDILQYPALNMEAADKSWQWHDTESGIALWYNYLPDHQLPGPGPNEGQLITFEYPQTYYVLDQAQVLIALLLITFVYCLGAYLQIIQLVKRLFLLAFIKNKFPPLQTPWPRSKSELGNVQQRKQELGNARANNDAYENAWKNFSPEQRLLLAQLAVDGITNGENADSLYYLMENGWLVEVSELIRLKDPSFAYFVRNKIATGGMLRLRRSVQEKSSWSALKVPLQIVLLFAAGFVFFTQAGIYQQGLALITGIGSMLGVIKNLPFSWAKGSSTAATPSSDGT